MAGVVCTKKKNYLNGDGENEQFSYKVRVSSDGGFYVQNKEIPDSVLMRVGKHQDGKTKAKTMAEVVAKVEAMTDANDELIQSATREKVIIYDISSRFVTYTTEIDEEDGVEHQVRQEVDLDGDRSKSDESKISFAYCVGFKIPVRDRYQNFAFVDEKGDEIPHYGHRFIPWTEQREAWFAHQFALITQLAKNIVHLNTGDVKEGEIDPILVDTNPQLLRAAADGAL